MPDDKIYRDQDPSLTISQGVAEVARLDLRTSGKDSEIGRDIEQLKQSSIIYDDFIIRYAKYLNWDLLTKYQNLSYNVICRYCKDNDKYIINIISNNNIFKINLENIGVKILNNNSFVAFVFLFFKSIIHKNPFYKKISFILSEFTKSEKFVRR